MQKGHLFTSNRTRGSFLVRRDSIKKNYNLSLDESAIFKSEHVYQPYISRTVRQTVAKFITEYD